MTKEYRPISNRGEPRKPLQYFVESLGEPERLYPESYYEALFAFEDGEHIVCGDELFSGKIPYEDIREIFFVMKLAGNRFENKSFEVKTEFPSNLISFMSKYNEELCRKSHYTFFPDAYLKNRFDELRNITFKTTIHNQEISISCDELLRLIHQSLINSEEDLLSLALESNNQEEQEQKNQIRRHK